MATKEQQKVGFWLTPAGCLAAGGHTQRAGVQTCVTCGSALVETPAEMLERAEERLAGGCDPQRLVDVGIQYREKWARLVEEQESGVQLDGRASIYTGETYVEARDRWDAYLGLLTAHLSGVEGGLL